MLAADRYAPEEYDPAFRMAILAPKLYAAAKGLEHLPQPELQRLFAEEISAKSLEPKSRLRVISAPKSRSLAPTPWQIVLKPGGGVIILWGKF